MVSPGIAVTTTGTEVAFAGGSRRPLRISATEVFQSRLGLQFVAPSVGRDSGEIVAGGLFGRSDGRRGNDRWRLVRRLAGTAPKDFVDLRKPLLAC